MDVAGMLGTSSGLGRGLSSFSRKASEKRGYLGVNEQRAVSPGPSSLAQDTPCQTEDIMIPPLRVEHSRSDGLERSLPCCAESDAGSEGPATCAFSPPRNATHRINSSESRRAEELHAEPTSERPHAAETIVNQHGSLPTPSSSPQQVGSSTSGKSADESSSHASSAFVRPKVQLIDHLPRADAEAMSTFEEIKTNQYLSNKGSRSKLKEEGMVCECRYRYGIDPPSLACGEDSGCINRLTQVECSTRECRCGDHCQNQRFQRKQYADVAVVKTETKGFGLRAAQNLDRDSFVYEYFGEIVTADVLLRRMRQYSAEGIRHFYFMALDRDEYIDATKKGGVARFINHSCNPNCCVAKWHVGRNFRMGIFAKRAIQKGEELTFNYNVDRYGHDAQPCHCGEPNCVGTLGGKTDLSVTDQLFIEALGIKDDPGSAEMRGARRRKSKNWEGDLSSVLRPLQEAEVTKVATAVRQATSNRMVLFNLLQRIYMTEAQDVQKALVRLHGFMLMARVIEEWKDDVLLLKLALGSLARWPLLARNKVVDAGVDRLVQDLASHADEGLASLATELLAAWHQLELSYRIARKEPELTSGDRLSPTKAEVELHSWLDDARELDEEERKIAPQGVVRSTPIACAPNAISERLNRIIPGPLGAQRMKSQIQTHALHGSRPPAVRPSSGVRMKFPGEIPLYAATGTDSTTKPTIEEIIERANAAAARHRQAEYARITAQLEGEKGKGSSNNRKRVRNPSASTRERSEKTRKGTLSGSDSRISAKKSEERLAKKLESLVGAIVVKCMSKYQGQLEKETFKKHAKELTRIICTKEKKASGWPPINGEVQALSGGKMTKIKAFTVEYTLKLLEKKGQRANPKIESAPAASSPPSTRGSDKLDTDSPFLGDNSAKAPSGDASGHQKEKDIEDDDPPTPCRRHQSDAMEQSAELAQLTGLPCPSLVSSHLTRSTRVTNVASPWADGSAPSQSPLAIRQHSADPRRRRSGPKPISSAVSPSMSPCNPESASSVPLSVLELMSAMRSQQGSEPKSPPGPPPSRPPGF